MTIFREIKESPLNQGVDEIIVYTLTTTPWGSSPGTVSVKVYDITAGEREDVTTTVMPTNSPSVLGDVITLSPLKLLTVEHTYRMEIKFASGSNTFESFAIVNAEY